MWGYIVRQSHDQFNVRAAANRLGKDLSEIKADRANALGEVKAAKKDALASIQSTAGNKTSKVWLVLKWGGWNFANTSGIEKIEMSDMNQCELMGAQWMASPRAFPERYNFEKMAYVCIES